MHGAAFGADLGPEAGTVTTHEMNSTENVLFFLGTSKQTSVLCMKHLSGRLNFKEQYSSTSLGEPR